MLLLGCTAPDEPPPVEVVPRGDASAACRSDDSGFVKGELFGGLELNVEWPNLGTECEGMARPDDGGARLRFARTWADSADNLVLIIGISDLRPGDTGNGLAANVTLIDERTSTFFANGGVPNCWVDVYRHLESDSGEFLIDGILYCSGALASQSGTATTRIRDIRFGGKIDWAANTQASPAKDAS